MEGALGTRGSQRDQQAQSESTACLGTAFPKRNSSSQILVLWSASNNEILKNSWQENIKNKTKQTNKKTTPWAPTHTKRLRISGTQALTFLKASPPQVILPSCCLHRPRVATEHLCVSPNPDMLCQTHGF